MHCGCEIVDCSDLFYFLFSKRLTEEISMSLEFSYDTKNKFWPDLLKFSMAWRLHSGSDSKQF